MAIINVLTKNSRKMPILIILQVELSNLFKMAFKTQLDKSGVAVVIQVREGELRETKKLLDEALEEINFMESELSITNKKLQVLQELAITEKSYALHELKHRADLLQKADEQIVKYEVKL